MQRIASCILLRESCGYLRLTTPSSLLDRRATGRAKRTEYAAIPSLGAQQRLACHTFVIELTGVGRHDFQFLEAALRALDNGLKSDSAHQTLTCGGKQENL